MADSTHNVGLIALIVYGIAHGFSINGQREVLSAIVLVPTLQGTIDVNGIDADKHIPDNVLTGDNVAAVFTSTIKALPGLLT